MGGAKMYTDNRFIEFTDIAIIGMSGRFPNAYTIEEFFNNLKNEKESIRLLNDDELKEAGVSEELLKNTSYKKYGSVLNNIKEFDNEFFDFTPYEAKITDPQHRIFLECVWEALEDAGYIPNKYKGIIGLYGSTSMSSYLLSNILKSEDVFKEGINYPILIANDKDYLCTRASYKLDLRGPSMTVQTACSSSLVAIHLACQSLINQECDIALAGGVSITVPQTSGYLYKEGGILSKDGHCRAFDDQASGTVKGNGCGIVTLKRLEEAIEDRDTIYAVIKGTSINNDGANKIGFTAPSIQGQAKVIDEALALTGISPNKIGYVETHGTGTPLGDPIEIRALSQAFQSTDKKQFCAIGSLKTNIGHLDAAAGVANIIKTALCLNNNVIPGSLNFSTENKQIDFENSPFYVNSSTKELEDEELNYAGVSAFGIGGTNAHAILTKAPSITKENHRLENYILIFSGKNHKTLKQIEENLSNFLVQKEEMSLIDVAYTLGVGRDDFSVRNFVIGKTKEAIIEKMSSPSFKNEGNLKQMSELSYIWKLSIHQDKEIYRELYANVSYFGKTLNVISTEIEKIFGQKVTSKQLLGISNWEDTSISEEGKDILSTFANSYALAKLLEKLGLQPDSIYCQNKVQTYVAACITKSITLENTLQLLQKHTLNEEVEIVDIKSIKKSTIPVITPQGCLLDEVSQSIDFYREKIKTDELTDISLENYGELMLTDLSDLSIIYKNKRISPDHEGGYYSLLYLLGKHWCNGASINWEVLYEEKSPGRISLPTYPFDRKIFWIEPTKKEMGIEPKRKDEKLLNLNIDTIRDKVVDIWKRHLEEESITIDNDYYEVGGDSLTAVEIVSEIRDTFNIDISINDFIEFMTASELADYIKEQLEEKKRPLKAVPRKIISTIKEGTTKDNIFLVHPAGGTVFCYHDLSQYLEVEGMSIYGIMFPQEKFLEEDTSIPMLASLYIKEMKQIQPIGPYTIGGYSFGGNVAFEMALQLEQVGDKVERIIMFDSHPPHAYNESTLNNIKYFDAFPYIVDMYLNQTKISSLKENEKYISQNLRITIQEMKKDTKIPATIDDDELIHFYSIWTKNHEALKQHKPSGVFNGNIILFKARETEDPIVLDLLDIKLIEKEQWKQYISGQFIIQEVSGDHYSMFGKKENCRDLASNFQQLVELEYKN